MTDTTGDALRGELQETMAAERAKKSTVEAKGLSVISTSGALLTILLGFAALVGLRDGERPSSTVVLVLTVGMALLALACLLGIACNLPGRYLELQPESLLSMTPVSVWREDGADARRELSLAHLEIITQWRRLNEIRGWMLLVAILLEVLGIFVVGGAVVAVAAGYQGH
ncbi:hypothetical protein [Kribbella speibonae]|uniref:Integral membrane plasmid transfer protein n=1 Tax=Kribbella speibonae TaxID=1572660 RepID=A0A4R0J5K4_9ACTN|nr:hypothetical protein [Kribbella speibonae]TCC40840.1 hypothetical protein E0H92_03915 [Kribbella speibonae]